jgi:hypothetical protein
VGAGVRRFYWSADAVAELKRRAGAGETAKMIARAMGATRGSVTGKARRLGVHLKGLDGRLPATAPGRARWNAIRRDRRAKDRAAKIIAGIVPARARRRAVKPGPAGGVPFLEVGAEQCRWPLTPSKPLGDFRFCGAERDTSRDKRIWTCPYCEVHTEKAYTRRAA